ncbi:MAG TPA: hypothetical protein VL400_06735, partial [Polyangiaceae bacterium]|nr:hypothetical protein [Polyangiaceae bacterium]
MTIVAVATAAMSALGVACDSEPEVLDPVELGPLCDDTGLPRWLGEPAVLASGAGTTNEDCRDGELCQHNENTDLFRFRGDLFLVHRTAKSQ